MVRFRNLIICFLVWMGMINVAESMYGQMVAVSSMRQNVVYAGITNQLKVVVEGASCGSISISTDNGRITKASNCEYNYFPNRSGLAQIVVKSSKGTYNYLMRVESLPAPSAFSAGLSGGRITNKQLVMSGGLQIKYPGLDVKSSLKVKHYSYQIFRENHARSGGAINGQGFTKEMKVQIDQMMRNDKVIFFSIVAEDEKGDTYLVSPIEFLIQ